MANHREHSDFLLRACHDLRTPVRAVRTHAELLLKDGAHGESADLGQRLGFVVDGARKIDLLVDGLAAYAVALKTDASSFQAAKLDVLLRGALAKLATPLREAGAEVTYDELPRVQGDQARLLQLFEQLLRNALDHRGEAAPKIHTSATKRTDGSWEIAVRDNGPGVDAEELERIFRPFERLRGHAAKGPGMGLAICRAIVEGHGGTMWAESDAGLTVRFTLPATA